MPLLGAHLSIAGGLPRAVERARATGCEAFQVFTKSVGQWRARPLEKEEIRTFRRDLDASGITHVFAHTSYLINVAAADAVLRERSMAALAEELDRAEALGLMGVVLHPGSYTSGTEAVGLRLIADGIRTVLRSRRRGRTHVLLEHTAGQGTNLGHRFEHLAEILERLNGSSRVGVCVDTCHLIAAGYDITSVEGYDATFRELAARVGFDRLEVFHLNDSKKPCGSRVDRHEHIGKGCLGLEPFRRLLTDSRFARLPMILETPKSTARPAALADPDDLNNLATLRRLRSEFQGSSVPKF